MNTEFMQIKKGFILFCQCVILSEGNSHRAFQCIASVRRKNSEWDWARTKGANLSTSGKGDE